MITSPRRRRTPWIIGGVVLVGVGVALGIFLTNPATWRKYHLGQMISSFEDDPLSNPDNLEKGVDHTIDLIGLQPREYPKINALLTGSGYEWTLFSGRKEIVRTIIFLGGTDGIIPGENKGILLAVDSEGVEVDFKIVDLGITGLGTGFPLRARFEEIEGLRILMVFTGRLESSGFLIKRVTKIDCRSKSFGNVLE